MSRHTSEWGMPQLRSSDDTRTDESCVTYETVMSYIWMSHVTHMDESRHPHWREHFWHFWQFFLLHFLPKRCFVHINSLVRFQLLSPHRALWCICENTVICALGHYGVDTSYIHTSEGDSVVFPVWSLPSLSRRRSTWGLLESNRFSAKEGSASLERFWFKSTRFWDETSCEVRRGEFGPQARFLCTAGKNLCAAGKVFWILMGNLSYWYNVINSLLND